MEIKDVGRRIARLRKENGWSQMGLAEKLNVSDKTVSKWENGGMPGIDLFPKMAKLFNVSIDYLMTGKEENDSSSINNEEKLPDEISEDKMADDTANTEKALNNVRKAYVCPKCNKVNYNPGTHCTYCYHEFGDVEVVDETEEEEEDVVILYDEATNKPICPKCNRINPYLDTYCVYCYHEFKKSTKKQSGASANNRYFNRSNKKNYYTANETFYTAKQSAEQVSCLAYFVACLFPLAGLIWGLVEGNKGLTIASVIFMILKFLALIPLLLLL